MNIKVILGIDQKGTSKEALEEVLSWGVKSYIYHTEHTLKVNGSSSGKIEILMSGYPFFHPFRG